MFFNGRRRFRQQRGAYGDFVNIEDLPAQSSKMLIWVGLQSDVHRDECIPTQSSKILIGIGFAGGRS